MSSRFTRNAAALTAASLSLNLIGMSFRVWLSGRLGADGMGLYTLIISAWFLAATFGTSGMGLAVTRLVSECTDDRNPEDVLKRALCVSACLGAAAGCALWLSADAIGIRFLNDARTVFPLKISAIGMPFVSCCACFAGYLVALGHVMRSVLWQLLESVSQILITAVMLSSPLSSGAENACCAVIIGSVASEAVSFGAGLLMCGSASKEKKHEKIAKSDSRGIYRGLWDVAAPTALASYFRSGMSSAENALLPRGFAAFSGKPGEALAELGIIKGMSMPVVSFPATVTGAVCTLLVPELAQAASVKNRAKIARISGAAIRGTLIYSILVTASLVFFGRDIGFALYDDARAGTACSMLAAAVPFMYMDTVADSILKALGGQVESMRINMAEGAARLLFILLLVPTKGAVGFTAVMLLSNALSSILGLVRVKHMAGFSLRPLESVIKPTLAAAISGFAARMTVACLSLTGSLRAVFGIVLMLIFYAAFSRFCLHSRINIISGGYATGINKKSLCRE